MKILNLRCNPPRAAENSKGCTDLNLSRGGRKKGMEILFKRCSADHTANIKCKKASVAFPVFWACLLAALLKVASGSQVCPVGFTGSNCSVNIDDCLNVNCSGNGNCSDRVDGYYCFCFDGYYGMDCEINAGPCLPNPCNNNGTCTEFGRLVRCNCTPEYEGEKCESEKPQKIFTVKLTMVDRIFVSAYEDLTAAVTGGLIKDLTDIFGPFFKDTFLEFRSITFLEFFSGSVGAIFDVAFAATSKANETSIIQALKRANGTSQLRFEFFGLIEVGPKRSTVTTTTSPTDSSSSLVLEDWILALIIAAAVIALVLLIILILVILLYRQNHAKKKEMVAQNGDWYLKRMSFRKYPWKMSNGT
ncbi:uncharacterized protein [Montipora foliosa]|uniref:uncharacterized protein n=1 Tax=Montipora foliosa TaxID=591990 RepID=UPI0035F176D4